MSRSRSRSRERKKDRHRDRRSRSRKRAKDKRSRSRDRDRKISKDRDYKKRDRSHSREKYSRKRSPDRHRRRDSRDKRLRKSSSNERNSKPRSTTTDSGSVKPIIIAASQRSRASRAVRSTSEAKVDHRKSFEISNEFSEEGFEQFSRDHGIDFTNIETDEDKQELHAKMEEVLKEHFAAQGKIYPPPKPEIPAINAATGFANDGSFLEQFKKMQEEYKQQLEDEKRRKLTEDRLKSLPSRRRFGGKILKTGIVAKTVTTPENQPQQPSTSDAFSLYFKELQKYKNASCDGDSKTRPLVK